MTRAYEIPFKTAPQIIYCAACGEEAHIQHHNGMSDVECRNQKCQHYGVTYQVLHPVMLGLMGQKVDGKG